VRIFIAAIMIGPLMLIGALPASGQSPAVRSAVPGNDANADRQSYARRAQDDMLLWRERLEALNSTLSAGRSKGLNSAEKDLDAAWTASEVEARRLQTAGAADWALAKQAYEKASRDLAVAWDRIGAENVAQK
jgi:hypothetical protein